MRNDRRRDAAIPAGETPAFRNAAVLGGWLGAVPAPFARAW